MMACLVDVDGRLHNELDLMSLETMETDKRDAPDKSPMEKSEDRSCGDDRFEFGRKIFVGNVGYRVGWKQLQEFFSKFATVTYTHIVKDHLKNRSRGIAFVTFATEEEATAVLQLPSTQLVLEDRVMRIYEAEESKRITFKKYQVLDLLKKDEGGVVSAVPDTPDVASVPGPSLNDLCDDLLLEIISYLPVLSQLSIARVCRRWQRLSLINWSTVKSLHFRNTFSRFRGVTDKLLQFLLSRCGSYLQSLDLSASPRTLSDYSLDIIGHFCPNLTYLDLSGVSATNKSLKNLTKSCQKLKVIKLQRCQNVAEKGLWWVLHHCKELEAVDVRANLGITGKCFHVAGPNLKIVNLSGCTSFSDTGIEKLAEFCPLIEELRLQGCVNLSQSTLITLGTKFPRLQILEVSSWDNLLDDEAWSPLGHSRNLVELYLGLNVNVGDTTLTAISSGCQKLRILDITGCDNATEVGLMSLAQLSDLEDLTVNFVQEIQDDSLKLLAVNGHLQKLSARGCNGLTDAGVQAVAMHCNQLKHLDLSGNMNITNTSVAAILESMQDFPRRVSLHLGGTNVCLTTLTLPPTIEVGMMDLSLHNPLSQREFLVPEWCNLQDEDNDVELVADVCQPAQQIVGECPWLEDDTRECPWLEDDTREDV